MMAFHLDNKALLVVLMCVLSCAHSTEDFDSKKDLVLVPESETSDGNNINDENASGTSFKDENDFDIFQATDEWQTVKEGQAIPQGLHVQMNLETGEKRAKRLDESEQNGKENEEMPVKDESTVKQEYVKIAQNIISKQKLKEALKDFKDKFQNEDLDNEMVSEHEKNKYRSMDEIKEELNGANIWMKTDIEIMQELVEKLNSSETPRSEIMYALEELEYHAHQVDNAQNLAVIGGLDLLMSFLNQSDDDEIRSRAALAIGSAAQSNIPVQRSFLDAGVLPLLTRLIANQHASLSTRKNSMYALSSLLRLFQKGTQRFLKIGGLSVLGALFKEDGNEPLRVKSLTLLVDLVTEQMDSIRKKAREMGIQDYEKATVKAPLLKTLYDEGWCELATSLMTSIENDTREKVLQSLQVLWPACKTSFRRRKLGEGLAKWRHEWQEEIRRDSEDTTGYLESLMKLLDSFASRL